MIEILTPSSREEWLELRKNTIGASEVAAVLGVHPYMTPYELWWRKRNALDSGQPGFNMHETKAMRRGRLLEDDCIEILKEERPEWTVKQNVVGEHGKFYRDLGIGISATPDAFVFKDVANFRDIGICQIKTVNERAFRDIWIGPFGDAAEAVVPSHVAIQAIQEAHLTGASWVCVAAFVGMNLEPHIMDVEPHPGLITRICGLVPKFLRRIRENDPPDPDYARDAETTRARYAEDDGGEVDLSGNERVTELLRQRELCKSDEAAGSASHALRQTMDAELIHLLGNATRGNLGDGRYIEAKTVRKKECVHPASVSRPIKIKQRREK